MKNIVVLSFLNFYFYSCKKSSGLSEGNTKKLLTTVYIILALFLFLFVFFVKIYTLSQGYSCSKLVMSDLPEEVS